VYNEELQAMICAPHGILFGWSNQDWWDGLGSWHLWGRGDVDAWFLWGNLREIDHLADLFVERRLMSKWIFKKQAWGLEWSGSGEGQVTRFYESNNENLCFIKCEELLN